MLLLILQGNLELHVTAIIEDNIEFNKKKKKKRERENESEQYVFSVCVFDINDILCSKYAQRLI